MRTKLNLAAVQDKKNLKQRREEQRKASEVGGDTQVLEYIANKHGISQSELLDREADDLAVRTAVGETQLIAEAKKVNIATLEECASGKTENIKRSSHIIMVKNLPYDSSEGDLASIFGKFGSLDKVILPPTKMLALVIFLEATGAQVAFKSLAHRLYKDLPLYLEWAPENVLSPNTTSDRDERKNVISEKNINSILLERSVEGIHQEDIDPDRIEVKSELLDREADDLAVRIALGETQLIAEAKKVNIAALEECASGKTENIKRSGHVIMVKNLPYDSSEGDLASIFGKFGSLDKVILPPTKMLALVIFLEAAEARVAFKSLAHRLYKDSPLYLEWAPENVLSPDTTSDKYERKVTSEKNINNILLEGSVEGIHQEDIDPDRVEVKSLRLPKKFGSHRGFAVVECVTKQEAQNAIQSLSSTHLYDGRHLVIEGAEKGEELRARTAAQFVDEQGGFQKLSRKRKHMATLDEGTENFATVN